MNAFQQYLMQIESLSDNRQGGLLSCVLALNDSRVEAAEIWTIDVRRIMTTRRVTPLHTIIIQHVMCIQALHRRRYIEAFNYKNGCTYELMRLLKSEREMFWMLPILHTFCSDLRACGQKAEDFAKARGQLLRIAVATLTSCLWMCLEDTSPEEYNKKIALLEPANNLMRLYFKSKQYQMCNVVITAIEPIVNNLNITGKQKTTFQFFVGRNATYRGEFQKAEKYLTLCLKNCHNISYKNMRAVYTYLLPVKMILGVIPHNQLFIDYKLPLYRHFFSAVQEGDLKVVEELMTQQRSYFEEMCLTYAMHTLKKTAYRNVIKKVCDSFEAEAVIPIHHFQVAFQKALQREICPSEVQNIINKMIKVPS